MSYGWRRAVPFMKLLKPLQGEIGVDDVDGMAGRSDDGRKSAGRDDPWPRAQFLGDAVDESVDQSRISVANPRLNGGECRVADRTPRLFDGHQGKQGGFLVQGRIGDADAGGNRSADVVAFRRDHVDGRGRSEIDDEQVP